MTSGVEYTAEEIATKKAAMIAWIAESVKGTFSQACDFVGIDRTTGYKWKNSDADYSDAIDAARKQAGETGLDMLETAIFKAVNAGNIAAIIFSLKCLGRDRGWIEKSDVNFEGNMKVTHEANLEYVRRKLLPSPAGSGAPETLEQAVAPRSIESSV